MRLPLCSFLDLPAKFRDPVRARYAVLPIPYESASPLLPGTMDAPAAIIDSSRHIGLFDDEMLGEFHRVGIATMPSILPADTIRAQMDRVASTARCALNGGKFLLALGGERSMTIPLVRAVSRRYPDVSVLQIDAHAGFADHEDGRDIPHCSVMRRILEIAGRICQVGIRSLSRAEYEEFPDQARSAITPQMAAHDPLWIDHVLSQLGPIVYVTIDVDGFDPSCIPGTARPVPAGLTWRQVTSMLYRVCTERRVVAADIVEVLPVLGTCLSEQAAARLAYKIIAYTQLSAGTREE